MDKLNINQWAEEDRPREKLMRMGAEALSNAELLAILIGSGSTKESAVDLMKRVLNDCNNNLNTLGKMSISQLCEYNGVGEAKAITILAMLSTATKIYNHMHPMMQDLDVEEFWLLLMNQDYRLIKKVRIAHGGITEVSVDVRIIMREAVLANATVIAVCHNHPSGSLRPSQPDNDITAALQQACNVMRIRFQDHVIVTDGAYYSYRESGKV